MSIVSMLAIALLGMGLVAALSFAVYARLPRTTLDLVEKHGRYSGLGSDEPLRDQPAGNRPAADLPTLQGQSA